MMIDDDTLKQLLRINDELLQLCKFSERKTEHGNFISPLQLVDDLTHILIEAGKNNCTNVATRRTLHYLGIVVPRQKLQCRRSTTGCLKCGYRLAWVVV